jgi:hypothetical protein
MKLQNRLHLTFILFTTIALTCCNNPDKEYFPKGSIRFKHYLKTGWLFEYYENGKMKMAARFINNLLEGCFISYHDNSNIEAEGNFHQGKSNGYFKIFYPTGDLQMESYYKDGTKVGIAKSYYKTGKLKANNFYENDSLIYSKKYDENENTTNIFRAFEININNTSDKKLDLMIIEKGPLIQSMWNILYISFILNNGDTADYFRAYPIGENISRITLEAVPSDTKKIFFHIGEGDIISRKIFYSELIKDITVK